MTTRKDVDWTTDYSQARLISSVTGEDWQLYLGQRDYKYLRNDHIEVLREYFRDERDRELGRWRSKEDPNYYVIPYIKEPDTVTVVYERSNTEQIAHRSEDYSVLRGFKEVGDEYFDAHPEKKPWHDAKEGEVWLMQTEENEYVVVANMMNRGVRFRDNDKAGSIFDPKSSAFTGGRRIWPESKES